jgi:hypothetical protein
LAKLEGQDKQEDIGPLLTRCSLDIIGGKFSNQYGHYNMEKLIVYTINSELAMGIDFDSQMDGSQNYVNAVH